MTTVRAAITGVGGYIPEYVLSNFELEKMVDTTNEWILSRTGIKERRILKEPGKGSSFMGTKAVEELLAKTNTDPKEIDLLICATVTPDFPFPSTANLISANVGAVNAYSYDINAACSGFLYALTTACQFVSTGLHKKVIVVGVDKMSSIIDYTNRNTCIIFGDGAGAVLIEPSKDDNGFKDAYLRSDGEGVKFLHMKAGGSAKPASHETVDAREHYVYQDGATVYKFAVTNMADAAVKLMERNNLQAEDIAYLVPHQANKRIIDATAERMKLGAEKIMMNIENYGNTTAGTLPLLLWDYEKQLKKGDKLVFAAFGGGFTWGALYLTWAYDTH